MSLKDSWPIKQNFTISPQIISFVPLWSYRLSTELEKYACVSVYVFVPARVWACVVYQLLCPVIQHGFSQYSFPRLHENTAQQPLKQPARKPDRRLQASPSGKVCCLCVHKHCHSVKLPSSSKGYTVIRNTDEINSSAPEKSRTQLPHLPVHIAHLLPLWWGIMQACLTTTICECNCW